MNELHLPARAEAMIPETRPYDRVRTVPRHKRPSLARRLHALLTGAPAPRCC